MNIFNEREIKKSSTDKIFDLFSLLILTTLLFLVAYPLLFVVVASLSDPILVGSGQVWFYPKGFTLEGYKKVLGDPDITGGYVNTVIYTLLGVTVNLVVTIPAAFSLSRKDLKGKSVFMILFLITMFISGGTIPTFIVVRNLGLLDSMWALILPSAMSVYNMIIARTFFQNTIPDELWEAAAIDGCSISRFFYCIVLPLSKAIIAIMVLYYGVGHWNSYYNAMLYLQDKSKFPLQLVMRGILTKNQVPPNMINADADLMANRQYLAEMIKYSLIIVSSVPVLMLYPFVQKYFIKGVMIGSVKG